MDDRTIVDSSYTAEINAPFEAIDLPAWCFALPDHEYQGCSPAHVAAGATTAPDGRRMSINVEVIGGAILIEHYVEMVAEKDRLVLQSKSDLFSSTGRSTIEVHWEMSVAPLAEGRCEFTNHVHTHATDEFLDFLARQGIPFEVFRAQRQPMSTAHNRGETPLFAASIERHALRNVGAAV
jgi:hypothetical protein